MNARTLPQTMSGLGRNALDLPLALLAAGAMAFLAFIIPPDLLARLVGSTGLPEILPAAAPPLGDKARFAVGAAGAIAIFGLVFALLRLIDRGARPARRDFEPEEVALRPRRRDFHPDAPSPRPLSANRDLGDPTGEKSDGHMPLWLAPAETEGSEAEPDFVPVEELPEPIAAVEPKFSSPFAESSVDEPPKPAAEPASIAELMARLEQGLARRQASVSPAAFAADEPGQSAPPAPEPDDRLQSAIDSLQRLAARQH